MGTACSYTLHCAVEYFMGSENDNGLDQEDGEFLYGVYDPNQLIKPEGRTKDIISTKHINHPNRYDRELYPGCDTVWKNFKRSAWLHPNRPFLGVKSVAKQSGMGSYESMSSVTVLKRLLADTK